MLFYGVHDKYHLFKSLLPFGLICCWACIGFSAKKDLPDLDILLLQLEKSHSKTNTMAVEFQQKKYFSFMAEPVISSGFILFSLPDKIRFDIVSPFPTTVLTDGKNAKRYELVEGEWRLVKFSGGKSIQFVMDQIGQWMQGKFSQQRSVFDLSVGANDPNSYAVINLKPRHKQFLQFIEMIRVHISSAPGYRVSRIDIFEPGGDRFSLFFNIEAVNLDLSDKYFLDPSMSNKCNEIFVKLKQQKQVKKSGKR